MKYSIVQINRNTEVTCVCGSLCEKISFEVADTLGNVETYGSTCIKSVLGIDTKNYENKRGVHNITVPVKQNKNGSFTGYHKELREYGNKEGMFKVYGKLVIADDFANNLIELNKERTLLNVKYKTTKSNAILNQKIQHLEVGQIITNKEIIEL